MTQELNATLNPMAGPAQAAVVAASLIDEAPADQQSLTKSRPRVNFTDEGVIKHIVHKLINSYETDDCHAYLVNHDVPNYDLTRDNQGNLLGVGVNLEASFTGQAYIPKIQNLLTIPREGKPTLEPGAATLGAALMIGHKAWRLAAKTPHEEHTIYIAKDYATGAHLHQCGGQPVAVAFSASNFRRVGKILKEKFPRAELTFFVNSGLCISSLLEAAWEAAQAVGALVIVDDVLKYKARTGNLAPSILLLDDRPLRDKKDRPKQSVSESEDLMGFDDEDSETSDQE